MPAREEYDRLHAAVESAAGDYDALDALRFDVEAASLLPEDRDALLGLVQQYRIDLENEERMMAPDGEFLSDAEGGEWP